MRSIKSFADYLDAWWAVGLGLTRDILWAAASTALLMVFGVSFSSTWIVGQLDAFAERLERWMPKTPKIFEVR